MRLIEIVRAVVTSVETLQTALDLAHRFGKETIVGKKDTQGLITSRLIALFIVEAARIVEEGIAEIEDVNRACACWPSITARVCLTRPTASASTRLCWSPTRWWITTKIASARRRG
jgi:hypothetical protein